MGKYTLALVLSPNWNGITNAQLLTKKLYDTKLFRPSSFAYCLTSWEDEGRRGHDLCSRRWTHKRCIFRPRRVPAAKYSYSEVLTGTPCDPPLGTISLLAATSMNSHCRPCVRRVVLPHLIDPSIVCLGETTVCANQRRHPEQTFTNRVLPRLHPHPSSALTRHSSNVPGQGAAY